ncbi:hypothetical protein, partial [Algoriphagus yeomjeoni]|uniref:hypothetical protein n=1 Tax=Algoriphagus yeomjeoni TaxID=291403 RepID=UPI001B869DF3
ASGLARRSIILTKVFVSFCLQKERGNMLSNLVQLPRLGSTSMQSPGFPNFIIQHSIFIIRTYQDPNLKTLRFHLAGN